MLILTLEKNAGVLQTGISLLCSLLLLTLFAPVSSAQVFPDPETRGVWIPAGYSPSDSADIDAMVKNLSAANFNVLYVSVWDGHSPEAGTIYPSTVVKDAGGPLQSPAFVGEDPLRTYIDIAHKYGMEVFAWFEMGSFDISLDYDSTNVPMILKAHPNWAFVQRDTTKDFEHTPDGYYFGLDPGVPAADSFVVNLYTELAKDYPDLDGIESDIEMDTTLSYSTIARARFTQETVDPDPLTLPANDPAWLAWRHLQITNVVKQIYENVKRVNPDCVVSGAAVPPYMSSYMLESWGDWAKNGYVDMLEPMLYLNTSDFGSQMSACDDSVPGGFQLSPGIALSSAGSIANTISEIQDARTKGAAGVNIWYYGTSSHYGSLMSYPDALGELKSEVFPSKTLPSFDDILVDNSTPGVFSKQGSWTLMTGGYGDVYLPRGGYGPTYYESPASSANTATYTFRILRSGNYSLYGYWSGDSTSNCKSVLVDAKSSSISKVDTVNQSRGLNTWNLIDAFSLNSGDTVRVTISGSGSGNVIADAFRLRRGIAMQLQDEAVPDSEHVLLKFNQFLLNPLASCTRVYIAPAPMGQDSAASAYVDNGDYSVLHVTVPLMESGKLYTLRAVDVVSANYDTSSFTMSVMYNPDSAVVEVDDATPYKFTMMGYPWLTISDTAAVGGSCRIIKQSTNIVRAEWAPIRVSQSGYYDVYASIPQIPYPVSKRCLYLVLDQNGTDSVVTSQQNAVNGWLDLGTFEYSAGEVGGVMLSSTQGADTILYLVADAVMFKRTVSITGVRSKTVVPLAFRLQQNYPNPFNPSTVIRVSLNHAGIMSLRIYNVLGQLVKVVEQGYRAPGSYSYDVNMNNFASGVYFYTLQEGTNIITKKMMLLK
ncbi:MAG: family 10 glycosylhydrolase [Bacteroidetes bacterium]|nr:family 10 glycosylhydrolase [Bacteroidota bacterium]